MLWQFSLHFREKRQQQQNPKQQQKSSAIQTFGRNNGKQLAGVACNQSGECQHHSRNPNEINFFSALLGAYKLLLGCATNARTFCCNNVRVCVCVCVCLSTTFCDFRRLRFTAVATCNLRNRRKTKIPEPVLPVFSAAWQFALCAVVAVRFYLWCVLWLRLCVPRFCWFVAVFSVFAAKVLSVVGNADIGETTKCYNTTTTTTILHADCAICLLVLCWLFPLLMYMRVCVCMLNPPMSTRLPLLLSAMFFVAFAFACASRLPSSGWQQQTMSKLIGFVLFAFLAARTNVCILLDALQTTFSSNNAALIAVISRYVDCTYRVKKMRVLQT